MTGETRALCVGCRSEVLAVVDAAPGIELTTVETAAAARERLGTGEFDIVLTDRSLSDSTGLDFVTTIADAVPVLFCPHEGDESLAGRAIAAGADGYVSADEVETHLLERLREIVTDARGGRGERNGDPRVTLSALKQTPGPDTRAWLSHSEEESPVASTSASTAGVGPNQRQSALVEQSPLAMIEWTTSLSVATWNPAAERLFGYSEAAARDRHPTELVVPEDERETFQESILTLLTEGKPVTTAVIDVVTATGERKSCEWYNTPLFGGDGSVAGVLSIVHDTSTDTRPIETLEALYETTRTLFRASSPEMVADRIVDVAREVLGDATVDIRLHDVDRNALVSIGAAAPESLPIPPIEPDARLWRPYDIGEAMTVERLETVEGEWTDESDVEALACYPLDHHGILIFGLPTGDLLGPDLHRLGNLLATTATAALDRAERERSLRRSQTIVEAIGDGVYAADRDGDVLAVNDTLVSMTGYARTTLERGHLSLILDEAAVERSQRLVHDVLETDVGAPVASAEVEIEAASGELIPCEATLSPLIEDGEYVGTVGILRDLSEHKHMQAELSEHRARIDALYSAALQLEECPDEQAVLDSAVTAAEDLFEFDVCSIAAYDAETGTLRVRSISSEASVFDRDEVRTLDGGIDGQAFESGKPQIAADLEAAADGQPIDGRFRSAIAVPIDEYGVFRAATTRPEAFDEIDARLAELLVSHVSSALDRLDCEVSREPDRFSELIAPIPDPVAVVRSEDGEAVPTAVNPAFEEVFGSEVVQFVEQPLDRVLTPAEDTELVEASVDEWPVDDVVTHEISRETVTGSREFELTISRLAADDEQPMAYLLYSDVTDRNSRQQRVEVLNRVLRHDLRNGMNLVKGSAEILREVTDDDQSQHHAQTIEERADELIALAEKTRAVERTLDRDGSMLGPIEVVPAIENPVDRLSDSHPEATFAVDAPDSVTAQADEMLQSAFYHLLHNAVVHNDQETPEVDVSVTAGHETIEIRVADNGPGIDPEEYELITENQEITQLRHASGLGLWLVNWVVTRAGGSLSFEENDPQGTVAVVELQAATVEDAQTDLAEG
jgi:PAS domain S-box-containing protein